MGEPVKTIRARIARLASLGFIDENGAEGHPYRAIARPSGA
jgi:hypothetical protein